MSGAVRLTGSGGSCDWRAISGLPGGPLLEIIKELDEIKAEMAVLLRAQETTMQPTSLSGEPTINGPHGGRRTERASLGLLTQGRGTLRVRSRWRHCPRGWPTQSTWSMDTVDATIRER